MYQALTEPRTIRLLRLVDCGPDALSYTWGAPISGIQFEQDYSVANSVRVRIFVEKEANEVCIGNAAIFT